MKSTSIMTNSLKEEEAIEWCGIKHITMQCNTNVPQDYSIKSHEAKNRMNQTIKA